MEPTSAQNGFYIVENGAKKGPLELSALQTMRQQGTLSESTLMWRDGMTDWLGARNVLPDLFPATTSEIAVSDPTPLALAEPKLRFLGGVIDVCILTLPSIVFTPFVGFAIGLIYEAVTMASEWQGTVGMKVLGLKVVDYSGDRISVGRSWGRAFASILSIMPGLSLGYWLLFFTPRRQTLHDLLASTLVIKTA